MEYISLFFSLLLGLSLISNLYYLYRVRRHRKEFFSVLKRLGVDGNTKAVGLSGLTEQLALCNNAETSKIFKKIHENYILYNRHLKIFLILAVVNLLIVAWVKYI